MKRTVDPAFWHKTALLIAGMTLAVSAACSAPDVPASPTWAEDVKPIMAAKCVRCHGYPAIQGAPAGFRLDMYDDFITADGRRILGAKSMVVHIATRTDPSTRSGLDGPVKNYKIALMPPAPIELTDEQTQVILNWTNPLNWEDDPDSSDPRPVRGTATGNTAPNLSLTRPLADSVTDGIMTIQYDLRDPDGDATAGMIIARDIVPPTPPDTVVTIFVGPLNMGGGEVEWDVGALVSGTTYELFAVIDDGARHELSLGTHAVNHANTAPTITIAQPDDGTVIADPPEPMNPASGFTITVDIADSDVADSLTMSVRAVKTGAFIDIATDVSAATGSNTLTWNTTGVDAGLWRLEVTVSDGTNTRTRTGSWFRVAHGTNPNGVTYEAVSTIFTNVCGNCHPQTAPDFNYTDNLARIYQRVVVQRNMPPESWRVFNSEPTDPQLTDAERTMIGEWILAGGPGVP